MLRFFIKRPDIKPRAQSQHILAVWCVILRCILWITVFHSRSLAFSCIAARLSARAPFVFTPVHSCSLVFYLCSLVFYSCSLVFTCVHSCSIRVHSCSLVFTRVHQCSLVFRLVWSFRSDPLVFCRVRSCSIRVHWCSRVFHSCSLVFTCVPTRVEF